jgi:ABC-type glycerol-3-phosphate transport system substrate-binding protein
MTEKVDRRNYLKYAAAGIVVVAGGAAGVYYATRPPVGPTETSTEAREARGIFEVSPISDELEKLVPNFERETGIRFIWESYSYEAYIEKEMTDFAAGTGIYDVVQAAAPRFFGYAKNNYLRPLDDYVNDPAITPPDYDWQDLIPGIMNRGVVDGKRYAVPAFHYINYLSYRNDLLEDTANLNAFEARYGYEYSVPPRDLAEYKDVVEFFHDPPNRYGTTICAKRGFAAVADWLVLLAANGGEIVDSGGTPQMNSQAAIDSVRDFVWLVKHSPPGAVEWEWDGNCQAMGSGNVAISIQWADHGVFFETDPASNVAGKIGYDAFPSKQAGKKVALWDGSLLGISRNSKHPREAYEFIKWVLSKNTQLEWARLGSTPTRLSVFNDPELRQTWPFYQAIETSMAEGVVFTHPRLAEVPEIEDIIALHLSKATVGESTPEEACAAAQVEIEALLKTS